MAKAKDGGEEPNGGIECSRCGCEHWIVVWTDRKPNRIVRRRECRNCGKRATTVERLQGASDAPS